MSNIDELLKNVIKSPEFIEALAFQIAQQYREQLQDDFGNQVTKALGEHVKETVEQYAKDWQTDENIKRRVSSVFRSIDKDELIKAIVGVDWKEL